MFRFTIRELTLGVLTIALTIAWITDRGRLQMEQEAAKQYKLIAETLARDYYFSSFPTQQVIMGTLDGKYDVRYPPDDEWPKLREDMQKRLDELKRQEAELQRAGKLE